ncbi:MAG: transcriptional repressor [Acidobacteriota bacterium]|nr:MAG: transcriptional repressor [Acidobacteriota bacterium]
MPRKTADGRKAPPPSLEECLEAFEAYLRRKGLRMTMPRRVLVERIYRVHDHFDADGLLVELRRKNIPVSRATIYRTLELLSEANLVVKTALSDARASYEFAFGHDHHDHLICNACGAIVEFKDDVIEQRQGKICREFGFTLACHSHKIYGLCPLCRRKRSRSARRKP